MIKWRRC